QEGVKGSGLWLKLHDLGSPYFEDLKICPRIICGLNVGMVLRALPVQVRVFCFDPSRGKPTMRSKPEGRRSSGNKSSTALSLRQRYDPTAKRCRFSPRCWLIGLHSSSCGSLTS